MSDSRIFQQNVIAIIWDFDKTLSPEYMQKPLFEAYGIDEDKFWAEVRALPEFYLKQGIRVNEDTCYLGHLLSYVQQGPLKGLTNAKLKELGAKIDLFPGLPDFFDKFKEFVNREEYREADVSVEHYIVSTGLDAMIRGNSMFPKVDGVWASVFIEQPAQPGQDFATLPLESEITQIANFLDNTTKTRAIFEINKGVNKTKSISVNDTIAHESRRVPFENMIYVADGPSDVPSFSVVKGKGGKAYAVYNPDNDASYKKASNLRKQNRVDHFGVANYQDGSETFRWFKNEVIEMADKIAERHQQRITSSVASAPKH